MSRRKKKRPAYSGRKATDTHHMLFQRRHWQQGYAHALRENWYFKVEVPIVFHRELHSKLHDIPVPNGTYCRKAYEKLIELEDSGVLTGEDRPEARLQFLIDEWEGSCPATAAVLRWQQQIFIKHFERGGEQDDEVQGDTY